MNEYMRMADRMYDLDNQIEQFKKKNEELKNQVKELAKDLAIHCQDTQKVIDEYEKENRLLGERCNQLLKDKGELTDQIADIKANCDLAIEGRDVKIKELEKENEILKGDLELWESGGCRATNLFECGVVKELKEHHKSVCETLTNTHRSIREQLTKATDLLKKIYYLFFDPCVTNKDLENRDKLFEEIKQLIKEIEK